MLATLAAGLAVGLSFGPTAYAGTVCRTTGDVSFCAQWGVMGYATRLQVKNTGSQTISSFTLALPSGVTVTGAAGNTGCHAAQPAANDVTCSTPTPPGQQQFVDILSNPTPAVGSSGTLTLSDSGGTPQPSQTVTLDSSAVCGLAAQTGAAACTTNTTSTTSTTSSACEPKLEVFKEVFDNAHEQLKKIATDTYATLINPHALDPKFPFHSFAYEITVTNTSDCEARDVTVLDTLPASYRCGAGHWNTYAHGVSIGSEKVESCKGLHAHVKQPVGNVGPHQHVSVTLYGGFDRLGETTNRAAATAKNAAKAESNEVEVRVISHKQFEELK